MRTSIIDATCQVSDVSYTLSLIHDTKTRERNYCNIFIVLEKMTANRKYILQLFTLDMAENGQAQVKQELFTDEKGQPQIEPEEMGDLESFKRKVSGKDCYVYSFCVSPSEAPKLIQNIQETKVTCPLKREDSRFFSHGLINDDPQITVSFESIRSQMLKALDLEYCNRDIPENIKLFKEQSKHVGDLSPQRTRWCSVL